MALSKLRARSDQWDLLGGVRFMLASIVVAAHISGCMPQQSRLIASVTSFGAFSAVLGFLVVSGYSIAHSIGERSTGFYLRRFRRIYPLYVLALGAAFLADLSVGGVNSHTPKLYAASLLFLQTFRTHPVGGNAVMWTLAVEAACYAMAPLFRRMRTSWLIGLAGLSAVAFVAYPKTHQPYYAAQFSGLPLLFLGWAWLAGFIYHRTRMRPGAGLTLVAAAVTLTTLNPLFMEPRATFTLVLCLVAVIASPHVRLPAAVRRTLAFAGDLSYPLYLFHFPLLIGYVFGHHGQSEWLMVGCSAGVALAMLAVDIAVRRPIARATDAAAARVALTTAAGRQLVYEATASIRAGLSRGAGQLAATGLRFAPVANVSLVAGLAIAAATAILSAARRA